MENKYSAIGNTPEGAGTGLPAVGGPIEFFRRAAALGARHYVANVAADIGLASVGGISMPTTSSTVSAGNCYLCCPRLQYVAYGRDEIARSGGSTVAMRALLVAASAGFTVAGADRILHLNNWLLPSSPWPAWNGEDLHRWTRHQADQFPDRLIGIRGLDPERRPALADAVRRAGYRLVPSRLVHVFPTSSPDFRLTLNGRRDLALLRRRLADGAALTQVPAEGDFERMAVLYRELNLGRYSALNPEYTPAFFRDAYRHGVLEFVLLRSAEGRLLGFEAVAASSGNVLIAAVLGHDLGLPLEYGAYRILAAATLEIARERRRDLHAGSGAGRFKGMRGARPVMEYNAYFIRHLPLRRRLAFSAIAAGLDRVAPRVLADLQETKTPGTPR